MSACAHCGRVRAAVRAAAITGIPAPALAAAGDGDALCCAAGRSDLLREVVLGPPPAATAAGREVEIPAARQDVASTARAAEASLLDLAAAARGRGRAGRDRDRDRGLLDLAAAAEDAAAHLARAIWAIDPCDVGRITWLSIRRD